MSLLWIRAAWDYSPGDDPAHIMPAEQAGYSGYREPGTVPAVDRFMDEHGPLDNDVWERHGSFSPIDLTMPVYATQSHLSRKHLDKYGPGQVREHEPVSGGFMRYLGEDGPMVVTHQGAHYVLDGHHRVGAALERGEPKVNAWNLDLDALRGSR